MPDTARTDEELTAGIVRERAKAVADIVLARKSLIHFTQKTFPQYQAMGFHRLIASKLEAVARGEITRLIISCPPRHGKSRLTSIQFPCWYLGNYPNNRIIATSYGADLAQTFSRQARNLLMGQDYKKIFPQISIAKDSRALDEWNLTAPFTGGYTAAGVGGAITGKGANILLIDDPTKNAEEASSSTAMEKIWDWYGSTAYTRLEGRGAIILILTRWSENDLAGRLLEAQSGELTDQWEVINLPALAEEADVLGRTEGEALWPEKFSSRELHRIESNIGKRSFSALYQQSPAPREGTIFKHDWWQYYSESQELPKFWRIIQYWDTAYQAHIEHDYSACVTAALCPNPNRVYILDVFQARLEFPALITAMQERFTLLENRGLRPSGVYVEDKASGTSTFQTLRAQTILPINLARAQGTKITRAFSASEYYRSGKILHPKEAPWREGYELTMEKFPAVRHDDIVDATTGAVLELFTTTSNNLMQWMRKRAGEVSKGSPGAPIKKPLQANPFL